MEMSFSGKLLKALEGKRNVCIVCQRRTDDANITGDGVCICSDCCEKLIKSSVNDYYDVSGSVERLFAPFEYDGILKKLLLDMKFRYSRAYAAPLAGLLHETLPPYYDFSYFDMLIPVPLHHKRQDERGFNQAELMAEELSERMGIPMVSDMLFRVRDTERQMSLSTAMRLQNVKGAFWACENVKNKNIILIDDIYTVGATVNECALALKENGAAKVDAVVLCTNFKKGTFARPPAIPALKQKKIL